MMKVQLKKPDIHLFRILWVLGCIFHFAGCGGRDIASNPPGSVDASPATDTGPSSVLHSDGDLTTVVPAIGAVTISPISTIDAWDHKSLSLKVRNNKTHLAYAMCNSTTDKSGKSSDANCFDFSGIHYASNRYGSWEIQPWGEWEPSAKRAMGISLEIDAQEERHVSFVSIPDENIPNGDGVSSILHIIMHQESDTPAPGGAPNELSQLGQGGVIGKTWLALSNLDPPQTGSPPNLSPLVAW